MYEKILVPLDGSALAEAILPYVTELAKGMGGSVVLLSVIDADAPVFKGQRPGQGASAPRGKRLLADAEAQAAEYLARIKERLEVSSETVVAVGDPSDTVIQEQSRQQCDLIAMSTHGRTGIIRTFLGSVTDKVLHHAQVPLLVFRPEEEQQEKAPEDKGAAGRLIDSLVVPLDGSELAESVLPQVEALARGLSLEVFLVEAINVRMEDVFYGAGFYIDPAPLEEELLEYAQSYLERLAGGLRERGIRATWNTVLDAPAESIAQFARSRPHCLIAMSTRGQSGFTRWLLGSVTEKVVRESGLPVLVVPARQPQRRAG